MAMININKSWKNKLIHETIRRKRSFICTFSRHDLHRSFNTSRQLATINSLSKISSWPSKHIVFRSEMYSMYVIQFYINRERIFRRSFLSAIVRNKIMQIRCISWVKKSLNKCSSRSFPLRSLNFVFNICQIMSYILSANI